LNLYQRESCQDYQNRCQREALERVAETTMMHVGEKIQFNMDAGTNWAAEVPTLTGKKRKTTSESRAVVSPRVFTQQQLAIEQAQANDKKRDEDERRFNEEQAQANDKKRDEDERRFNEEDYQIKRSASGGRDGANPRSSSSSYQGPAQTSLTPKPAPVPAKPSQIVKAATPRYSIEERIMYEYSGPQKPAPGNVIGFECI
jgi:hypothetical protein